ncbi:MAG: AsmA family protein [Hyphomicrobiaceae bacterium]|nr:AsmA family protein [Hyphomicrobiaceae bacterium]
MHDGYLQYRDDRSGITEFISGVNINVTGRSSIDPIFIDGSLNWNEEPVTIKIRLETLSDILEDRSALIEFHMNSKPAIISFDGKVVSGTKTRAEGSILCLSSSVKKFMYWIGIDLPKGNSLGPARLTSKFVATPTNVALTEANFSIGKVRSSGDVVVGLESSRPRIKSNLTISRLDIDSILSFLEGARSIKSEKPNLVKKHKLEQPLKQSIEKSLVYPSSNKDELSFRKKNVSKTSPVWNDKNIFKKLAFFDVVLKGKILALDASGFLIDKADLKLKLDNGLFKLNLDRVKLYGGHGYGFMTAAVGDRGLKVGANFSMNEIAANNFLADLLGIQAINGTARFKANLNGRGYTKHDIISNLSGTASFIIKNGSIIGWNVPKLLRDLQSGKLGNVNQTKTAKTFFSDFSASFNINRGVANTQNLRVISPVVRMTGSGDIDLGKRQVDKILRSKLLTVLEDKPDTINLPGIEIPLRITGSWDKPDVQLDLAAILINEELVRETLDTVRKLTDKISDKTTGEIIRGIIGDDKENVPSLLLKKLFKH